MYTKRCLLLVVASILMAPGRASAREPALAAGENAEAELHEAIRLYDDALRSADAAAAERFANLREKRTAFGALAHEPREESIRTYMDGNIAVYTTRLAIDGRYGGEAESGEFRAPVVWIRRDGRWQQLASQMTPIANPEP